MKEIYKTALWALISIPISLIGAYNGMALAHASSDSIFLIPFYPALFAISSLDPTESREWVFTVTSPVNI